MLRQKIVNVTFFILSVDFAFELFVGDEFALMMDTMYNSVLNIIFLCLFHKESI